MLLSTGLTAGASAVLSCPAGSTEYKVDGNPLVGLNAGQSAPFVVDGQTFTITKVTGPDPFEDDTFDFTSTIAVVEVLVKGGVGTNTYPYDPAATSGSGLHPPLNSGNQPPAISHVSFCAGDTPVTTTTTASTTSSSATSTSTSSTSTSTSSTSTSTSTPTTLTSTTTSEAPTSTTTTSIAEEGSSTTEAPTSTTSTTTEPTTTTSLEVEGNTSTTIFGTTTTSVATLGSTDPTTTTPTAATVAGTSTLPFTGGDTFPLLWLGITAVVGGAALLIRRRVRA